MDWANERYVRLYVRDTLTWKLLTWEGRAVLVFTLRKLDRSGVLDIGNQDPFRAVAAMTELPPDVVETGLLQLFQEGVFVRGEEAIVMPNFIDAQESVATPALRMREFRARRADTKRNASVTGRLQTVTTVTPPVTPSRAVPSLAVHTDAAPTIPINGSPLESTGATEAERWFETTLLPAYPVHCRTVGIDRARKWVRDNLPDVRAQAEISASLEIWKASTEWAEDGGRYVPGIGKWLSEKRYMGRPRARSHSKPPVPGFG